MCGRLNLIDDGRIIDFLEGLGVTLGTGLRHDRVVRVATEVDIVLEQEGHWRTQKACWWLLQEKHQGQWRPSRYTSFNTRIDKYAVPGSAGYHSFRHHRCLLVVRGFGETLGKGSAARYTDFWADDEVIVLAGLYRTWATEDEPRYSCSVVTTAALGPLAEYHPKASPLILPQDRANLGQWLDPNLTTLQAFTPFTTPSLPQPLIAQQVASVANPQPLEQARWCRP